MKIAAKLWQWSFARDCVNVLLQTHVWRIAIIFFSRVLTCTSYFCIVFDETASSLQLTVILLLSHIPNISRMLFFSSAFSSRHDYSRSGLSQGEACYRWLSPSKEWTGVLKVNVGQNQHLKFFFLSVFAERKNHKKRSTFIYFRKKIQNNLTSTIHRVSKWFFFR